ncbi:MAG TPA: response regulator transcription factor [Saprospiraceae bacterium]|nr:response regulator transcription factor [Saprospiraceae bacterium]
MKAVIIDDEFKNIEVLTYLLRTYCPDIRTIQQATSVKDAIPLIRRTKPDIVFLDIELPEENGFELLSYFNPVPFAVIFTTAHEQYAIQAIKASACDYLLKPIDHKELILAVEKAKNTVEKTDHSNNNKTIQIPTINGFLLCNIDEILYCQADGRYTNFYLENGKTILSSKNLGEYDFSNTDLIRVHRSHVVNVYKITEYVKGKSPYVLLLNKISLKVSNQYKNTLLDTLAHI